MKLLLILIRFYGLDDEDFYNNDDKKNSKNEKSNILKSYKLRKFPPTLPPRHSDLLNYYRTFFKKPLDPSPTTCKQPISISNPLLRPETL